MPNPPAESIRHSYLEDAQALLIGAAFCGFGLYLLRQAGLATGGIAGVALLLSYVTPFTPGRLFVLLNIPFYYFAWRTLGLAFAIKTIIATTLVGLIATALPALIGLSHLDRVFAALFGGALIGIGILALARHRSGVGGVGVLALFLQEKRGLRAGYVQMFFDACILVGSLFVFKPDRIALSVLCALTTNIILVVNHRPGRYAGY